MTLYVGDTVQLIAVAFDPLRNLYVSDATVVADVFGVDKDPANIPADRLNPQVPGVVLTWTPDIVAVIAGVKYSGAYLGQVETPTPDFVPGRYVYRVRASGTVNPNSEFAAFVIK